MKSLKSVKRRRLGRFDWQSLGPGPVIGVDEVGRGCLAGPVVAAAVRLTKVEKNLYFDSKVLSEKRREELSLHVERHHCWAVGFASVEEIDRINIFHASLLAMRRAVEGLALKSGGHVLVDGKFTIPELSDVFSQTALVQGDSRAAPISAASIVAKVTRDRLMAKLADEYPEYGFEIHKGYGTLFHHDMLAALGPCAIHRRSFNLGEGDVIDDLASDELSTVSELEPEPKLELA